MYRIKRIRTLEDAKKYQQITTRKVNVELPLSYLRRCKTYVVTDKDENFLGGFAMVMEGDLRSFASLPSLSYLPRSIDRWDVCELNGLWISSELKRSPFSAIFWVFLLFKLFSSRKKYFTYTYSFEKKNLQALYSKVYPTVLYRGETKMLEGMDAPDFESIELVGKLGLIRGILSNPMFFIKRFRVKKAHVYVRN
jgi:hypothetical protein